MHHGDGDKYLSVSPIHAKTAYTKLDSSVASKTDSSNETIDYSISSASKRESVPLTNGGETPSSDGSSSKPTVVNEKPRSPVKKEPAAQNKQWSQADANQIEATTEPDSAPVTSGNNDATTGPASVVTGKEEKVTVTVASSVSEKLL